MAPAHYAARADDVEALCTLLDADPRLIEAEHEFYHHQRPLHLACKAGSMKAVLLLLDRGASTGARDASGMTPLLRACEAGRVEVVALLLERGADPTRRSHLGGSALKFAAEGYGGAGSDHVAVIRLLLKDGRVPADAQDSRACTALRSACYMGYAERARVLLVEGGADHSLLDAEGRSAMAMAKRGGHRECMRLLRWYECELERAFVLSRARAVVDAAENISKAPEKVGAKTEAEAQQAREEAAPRYLRGRVERGQALPEVEVSRFKQKWDREMEEEVQAVCQFLVRGLAEDLHIELMQGLTYRRWVPHY